MRPRRTHSTKRKIRPIPPDNQVLVRLQALAGKVSYGGNPEHKRNPGDFDLSPPSQPRQLKTLCDEVGILTRADALALLREGIRRGLVSVQENQGWPLNVWAVSAAGLALEARLENPAVGTYHGYPILGHDPMIDEVLQRWEDHQ
jgi:hypothetical protein